MSTSNIFKSDLPKIYNVIQNSMLSFPKEIIIASLREYFGKCSYYHYSKDKWGFANTPDHTDLLPGVGMHDELTTRVFIGENFRQDVIYYPAIIVKSNGAKYVPISINREQGSIKFRDVVYDDGLGNEKIVHRPISMVTAGAWEGSITIEILTRSLRARDDLAELIGIFLAEIQFDSLQDVGLIVKPPSIGSPSERDDRNDKLFMLQITFDTRTEWRREIPIETLIDAINFNIQFADYLDTGTVDPALDINTSVNLLDLMLEL
jgi:hypothetical protein